MILVLKFFYTGSFSLVHLMKIRYLSYATKYNAIRRQRLQYILNERVKINY